MDSAQLRSRNRMRVHSILSVVGAIMVVWVWLSNRQTRVVPKHTSIHSFCAFRCFYSIHSLTVSFNLLLVDAIPPPFCPCCIRLLSERCALFLCVRVYASDLGDSRDEGVVNDELPQSVADPEVVPVCSLVAS